MTDNRPRLTLGQAAKASGLTKPTVRARLERAGFDVSAYATGASGSAWKVPVDELLAAGVPVGRSRPDEPLASTDARSSAAETDLLRAQLDAARTLSDERGRHLDDLRIQLEATRDQVAHLAGLLAVLTAELSSARADRASRRGLPWRRSRPDTPGRTDGNREELTGTERQGTVEG